MQIRFACDDQQKQDKHHQETWLEPLRFTGAPRTKPHEHTFAAPPNGSRRPQTVWRTQTGNEQEELLDRDVTEMIRPPRT